MSIVKKGRSPNSKIMVRQEQVWNWRLEGFNARQIHEILTTEPQYSRLSYDTIPDGSGYDPGDRKTHADAEPYSQI